MTKRLSWWPEPGTELDAWWSKRTMDVISRVWGRYGATLYWRRGTEQLRDDLRSWLVEQAMNFRSTWVPPDDPYCADPGTDGPELTVWLNVLHAYLANTASWHFAAVNRLGVSREETRQIVYSTDSLDRPLETGDSATVGDGAGYVGLRSLWRSDEPDDPADHLLRCEYLTDQVDRAEGRVPGHRRAGAILSYDEALSRLDKCVPAPAPTQCVEFDCPAQVVAQHRCDRHYHDWLTEQAGRSRCQQTGEDGEPCDSPVKARGLCSKHYKRVQAAGEMAPIEKGVCREAGCSQPCGPSGLCRSHYNAHWRDGAGPCGEPDCDRPVKARGLCGPHYRKATAEERKAAAQRELVARVAAADWLRRCGGAA